MTGIRRWSRAFGWVAAASIAAGAFTDVANGNPPSAVAAVNFDAPAPPTQATRPSTITFDEVHGQFSSGSNLTDLQKDRAWRNYEGKCVQWTGELVYLDERFFGGFAIGFRHRRDTFTYDVLVDAPRSLEDTLLGWVQGRSYTYVATLKSYGGVILPISADWGCDD